MSEERKWTAKELRELAYLHKSTGDDMCWSLHNNTAAVLEDIADDMERAQVARTER